MNIQEIGMLAMGALIIFLMGHIMITSGDVQKLERDIKALTKQLSDCQASVKLQNAAIETEKDNDLKIQSAITRAEKTNQALSQQQLKQEEELVNTPELTSCTEAVKWGAQQLKKSAGHWQTTAI